MSPRSFLWSKFWTSLIPLLILAEVLIILSNTLLKVTPFMMVLSSLTLFFVTFGVVGLGVGMGALYPRFKVENAAQIVSGFGGAFYMILSMVFIGMVVILEGWPVHTLLMAELYHRALSCFEWAGIIISFLGVAILNGMAVIIPMRMGIKNITEMDF
jgi:ABC-2 type transport system permease protein